MLSEFDQYDSGSILELQARNKRTFVRSILPRTWRSRLLRRFRRRTTRRRQTSLVSPVLEEHDKPTLGNPASPQFCIAVIKKYWPSPAEVYRGNLNHTLKSSVLLISEMYDPATPLRHGRRLLEGRIRMSVLFTMGMDIARDGINTRRPIILEVRVCLSSL